jgi:hypothetical protein
MMERINRPNGRAAPQSKDPAAAADEAAHGQQNEVLAQGLRPGASDTQRHERIAALAYQRAGTRNFAPGGELEDWLSAEREIDAELATHKPA